MWKQQTKMTDSAHIYTKYDDKLFDTHTKRIVL